MALLDDIRCGFRYHPDGSALYFGINKTARRINKAIDKIAEDPGEGPHIKSLKGRLEGKYRYAVGDLRIVW